MAVTPVSPITPLPDPPSRSQSPDTFSADADAFVAALPTFGDELSAAAEATYANGQVSESAATAAEAAKVSAEAASAAAVGATGYSATSTTPLSIGTGSKAFTTQSGKSFANGDRVTAVSRGSPANRMRGTVTYSGSTLTMTADEVEGSGSFSDWLLILAALEPLPPYGKETLWIPATAMVARTTGGPGVGSLETSSNKVNQQTLDFSPSSAEYAQFSIRMPKSWNEGSVTFVPVWSHGAAVTNFGVSWGLQGVAIGDNEALDAAFGTAQVSEDSGGTTDRIYFGPASPAITIGGGPQAEDLVVFQVYRNPAAAADTLAVDARLHGVSVYITTNARNDA